MIAIASEHDAVAGTKRGAHLALSVERLERMEHALPDAFTLHQRPVVVPAGQQVANVEDEATGTLLISGTVEEGATISADISGLSDVDGGIVSTAYQWQISTDGVTFTDIVGETAATLSIPSDQSYVGQYVQLTAVTTDDTARGRKTTVRRMLMPLSFRFSRAATTRLISTVGTSVQAV